MVNVRKKGKIPHSEWPKILARYNDGESIAQIGRGYGCTAPAIRYIVKRRGALLKASPRSAQGGGTSGSGRPALARSGATTGEGLGIAAANLADIARAVGDDLRKRVSGDVASFLVALDQMILEGSDVTIYNLQDATDKMMRSTARVRLELEGLLDQHAGPKDRKLDSVA